jgi:hypothetical protein
LIHSCSVGFHRQRLVARAVPVVRRTVRLQADVT